MLAWFVQSLQREISFFEKNNLKLTGTQAWGTTFVGSLAQSYAVGALINATGTLSYKGSSYPPFIRQRG